MDLWKLLYQCQELHSTIQKGHSVIQKMRRYIQELHSYYIQEVRQYCAGSVQ